MSVFQRGRIWWYKFYFAGREITESSKSRSKTVAREAEKQRRREMEEGFHNLGNAREQRIRPLKEIIDEYLVGYVLRNRAPRFAKYALGHVKRLLGSKLTVDVDAAAVMKYQEDRLREGAAPKSINEEVRFLLKMLGEGRHRPKRSGTTSTLCLIGNTWRFASRASKATPKRSAIGLTLIGRMFRRWW